MRRNSLICIMYCLFFILFILKFNNISAKELIIIDEYYAYQDSSSINVYKDNVLLIKIANSQLLDMNKSYVLFNENNSIKLLDMKSNNITIIDSYSYNALFTNDNRIIYESDKDSEYKCKNIVGSIKYRNCYKLYSYDINNKNYEMIPLLGNDNYINDIENNNLVYTSIHNKDEYCSGICSFINIYNITTHNNLIIDKYKELTLEMSGNALIDNNVIYFESVPYIYDCNYTQIFTYDVLTLKIDMITRNENTCFTSNNEIVSLNDKYLVFRSNYGNYDNNDYINYIYSHDDFKYKKIDNNCKHNMDIIILENELHCYYQNNILSFKIDEKNPIININKKYVALKENAKSLLQQLEYTDDLSSNENIVIKILDNLDKEGEQFIKVEACDKFENCIISDVFVEIIDKDIIPPIICYEDKIIIKCNQEFILENYGYAIDNVDGKVKVELANEVDISNKGKYTILVKSEDKSGNISYKEIELVVYDTLNIKNIYFLIIMICLIVIIIIYILRFKNGR